MREFMIVNDAVVDTVVENEPIEVIPGTQNRFYKYARFVLERVLQSWSHGVQLTRALMSWNRGTTNKTSVPRHDAGACHGRTAGNNDPARLRRRRRRSPHSVQPTQMERLREQLFMKDPHHLLHVALPSRLGYVCRAGASCFMTPRATPASWG